MSQITSSEFYTSLKCSCPDSGHITFPHAKLFIGSFYLAMCSRFKCSYLHSNFSQHDFTSGVRNVDGVESLATRYYNWKLCRNREPGELRGQVWNISSNAWFCFFPLRTNWNDCLSRIAQISSEHSARKIVADYLVSNIFSPRPNKYLQYDADSNVTICAQTGSCSPFHSIAWMFVVEFQFFC